MLKKVEASDLYQLKYLSDVNYSPDGKLALFTVNRPDEASNFYMGALWLYDCAGGGLRQLTVEGKVSKAFWEDCGHVIFATSSREKVEKGHTVYYRISVSGGEAEKAFEIPERVRDIKPIENGKYLVTCRVSMAEPEDTRPDHARIGVDFEVFDELPFWFNGEGITNKTRDVAGIFDSATGDITWICDKDFKVTGTAVCPCKSSVAYAGYKLDKGVFRQQSGIWLYSIKTGETSEILPQGDYNTGALNFWDGELFFTRNDHQFPGANPSYCLTPAHMVNIRELPFPDAEVGGGVTSDASYGGGRAAKVQDGWLYMTRNVRNACHLVRMDKTGKTETVIGKEGGVGPFDIFDGKILFVGNREGVPNELYLYDEKTGEEKKVSGFNDEYVETHEIVRPERFSFTCTDGWELDGFVLPPVGYEKGKKYPGILEVHGGPKGIYGEVFNHEMQILCSRGFFVFFTNPRGGDGRGNAFADITGQLGGVDYQGLMEFTEETLKRYPDIDQENLACCGGSYGGFMANWMVGHTDRFKAACAQRSISDYLNKPFTTDIGYYHNLKQLATTPWEDFDRVWENSPLKNAPKAKAATLFIQSDEDYRCWQSDALQMFMAMRSRGVDCRMCLFKGENHNLSRNGKPKNRVSRLTEIADWFDGHLK
ncbi:MAG: S9 family peptidase [Firmicutes bacterium]|nr:S9 family peptidase [Bacillota bacterium]